MFSVAVKTCKNLAVLICICNATDRKQKLRWYCMTTVGEEVRKIFMNRRVKVNSIVFVGLFCWYLLLNRAIGLLAGVCQCKDQSTQCCDWRCLPDSPKLGFRVRVSVSANRDWTVTDSRSHVDRQIDRGTYVSTDVLKSAGNARRWRHRPVTSSWRQWSLVSSVSCDINTTHTHITTSFSIVSSSGQWACTCRSSWQT